MHRLEQFPRGQRRIVLVQDHLEPGGNQTIVDRAQPGRLLGMVMPHVVQLAVVVRDVRNRHLNFPQFSIDLAAFFVAAQQ